MSRAHQRTVCPSPIAEGKTHDEIWRTNSGAPICPYCFAPCPAAIQLEPEVEETQTQTQQVFAQPQQVFARETPPRHQGRIGNLKKQSTQAQADVRFRKLQRQPQQPRQPQPSSQLITASPLVSHRGQPGQVGGNFKDHITNRLKEATQETRGQRDSLSPWSNGPNGTVSIELVPMLENYVTINGVPSRSSKPQKLGARVHLNPLSLLPLLTDKQWVERYVKPNCHMIESLPPDIRWEIGADREKDGSLKKLAQQDDTTFERDISDLFGERSNSPWEICKGRIVVHISFIRIEDSASADTVSTPRSGRSGKRKRLSTVSIESEDDEAQFEENEGFDDVELKGFDDVEFKGFDDVESEDVRQSESEDVRQSESEDSAMPYQQPLILRDVHPDDVEPVPDLNPLTTKMVKSENISDTSLEDLLTLSRAARAVQRSSDRSEDVQCT